MTSAEFTRWIAYANLEPFGYPMDNWRHGVNTAAVVNVVRSTVPVGKGHARMKPIKAEAFMPARKKADELTPKQAEHLRRKREKRSKRSP
jgi:hypothetical protein